MEPTKAKSLFPTDPKAPSVSRMKTLFWSLPGLAAVAMSTGLAGDTTTALAYGLAGATGLAWLLPESTLTHDLTSRTAALFGIGFWGSQYLGFSEKRAFVNASVVGGLSAISTLSRDGTLFNISLAPAIEDKWDWNSLKTRIA